MCFAGGIELCAPALLGLPVRIANAFDPALRHDRGGPGRAGLCHRYSSGGDFGSLPLARQPRRFGPAILCHDHRQGRARQAVRSGTGALALVRPCRADPDLRNRRPGYHPGRLVAGASSSALFSDWTLHYWFVPQGTAIAQGTPGIWHNPDIIRATAITLGLGLCVAITGMGVGLLASYTTARYRDGGFPPRSRRSAFCRS